MYAPHSPCTKSVCLPFLKAEIIFLEKFLEAKSQRNKKQQFLSTMNQNFDPITRLGIVHTNGTPCVIDMHELRYSCARILENASKSD